MHAETIAFYNRKAENLCEQYDGADMSRLYELISRYAPIGSRILEIGCGSGRDARRLASMGYKVTACDASEGMLAGAKARSSGCAVDYRCRRFPLEKHDDLFSTRYALVFSVAMLMHLPQREQEPFIAQIAALLEVGGICLLSWCNRQSTDERLYEVVSETAIAELLAQHGLQVELRESGSDSLGRAITWRQLVARKIKQISVVR